MKKVVIITLLASICVGVSAQTVLNVEDCRKLALDNNKELKVEQEKINVARHNRKAAFTKYLPHISATGTYMRNEKELSMLSDEQKQKLSNLGTNMAAGATPALNKTIMDMIAKNPTLAPLLQSLGAGISGVMTQAVVPGLNNMGASMVDAFRTDNRNMYAGVLTLTQPIYMGGKIRAYNKITRFAEDISQNQYETSKQELILSSDQAYWQVVSLVNKKKLAQSYVELLKKLDNNVQTMIREGVATKADGLTVSVKLNEAEMTLSKVEDGLSLSRMLLCQICGIPLDSEIKLADEDIENIYTNEINSLFNMNEVYAKRPEIRSLELATQIYKQKVNIARSEHLPSVALVGNYIMSNPSVFNGFEKKFKGMWNVGVMVNVPIFSWGEGIHKTRAAKAEARMAMYKLDDTKEKIQLQVTQASYKVEEAAKKLAMANKNMDKAKENLHYAEVGFREGVSTLTNVLEAQTAWLMAQSAKIDSQIDVKLTEIYLKKATGNL